MTDHEVLARLRAFDDIEQIYRDYAQIECGKMSREALIARWGEDHEAIQYALYPERRYDIIPAAYLLGDKRNVAINKHPRYNVAAKHSHDYFELNYVLEGWCEQHFEEGIAKLAEGDICLLSPEAEHYITTEGNDSIVLNIAIRQTTFIRQFSSLARADSAISRFFMDNLYSRKKLSYLLVHTAGDEAIRCMILKMVAEEFERDAYTDDILTSAMTILFNLLLRRYGGSIQVPPMRQTQNALTDAMLVYIHNHYTDVTMAQMADAFHFSRQYCSKLIRELTGESFQTLVTNVRISHGETMLRDTSLSVEAISEKLGYANPETFIRAFQRKKDMTPGQYRKTEGQARNTQ